MNFSKKKKHFIKKILGIGSLFCVASMVYLSPHQHSKNLAYWYENLKTDRFEVREQLTTLHSSSNTTTTEYIDNKYELKILLNTEFDADNMDQVNDFNKNFITKIKNTGLNYLSTITSLIMPTVWIYFKDEKDRENLVNKVKEWPEIFKFIIYKNEYKSYKVSDDILEWIYKPTPEEKDYMRKYMANETNVHKYINSVHNNLDMVNGLGYDNKKVLNSKIGIMELYHKNFDNNYTNFFANWINISESELGIVKNKKEYHSTFVSLIAGGRHGVDKTSTIYLSTFSTQGEWQVQLEKMVIEDGVRLINHSNGDGKFTYSDVSHTLDYLSRKYGVINVIAAGNINDKNQYINSNALSFNSIVVGALEDHSTKENIKTNSVAYYSKYSLVNKHKDLAKPLVVAPGYFYQVGHNSNQYGHGTSYSSPFVTGLISNLLKNKPEIDNSEFRVPLVKVILSSSSITPKLKNLTYKSNGYEEKYGAGTVHFTSMLEAANNYSIAKINPASTQELILTSKSLKLSAGQNLKIAASWTSNADILKNSEQRIKYDHNKNYLFTNYDLILQKQDNWGRWYTIKSHSVVKSNDELIDYPVLNTGVYRYQIYKRNATWKTNFVDDLIAATHVVRND